LTKAGQRILASARQALAFARGETTEGFVVHVPKDVDGKTVLQKLDPKQDADAIAACTAQRPPPILPGQK
jgi:hypothetical protein